MMKYKKKSLAIATAIILAAIAYQQKNSAADGQPTFLTTAPQQYTKSTKSGQRKYNEYNDALKFLWTTVYPHSGKTLYCDVKFSTDNYHERKKIANAEHVYPMSWVTKVLNCGTRKACQANSQQFREIESDLHNIYPAQINVNKARSNYRFGEVAGEARQFGACDFEVSRKNRVAEPMQTKRGEIARAMRYLAYQYQLPLHKKTKNLMRKWDREDPPSAEEKRREKIIRQKQGRENPFITKYPFKG